jgi:tRNA nucleotidyltransferase (CCA-adding enzyme)
VITAKSVKIIIGEAHFSMIAEFAGSAFKGTWCQKSAKIFTDIFLLFD